MSPTGVDAVSAFIRQGHWGGASEVADAGWWGRGCDMQPHLSASGQDGGTPAALSSGPPC